MFEAAPELPPASNAPSASELAEALRYLFNNALAQGWSEFMVGDARALLARHDAAQAGGQVSVGNTDHRQPPHDRPLFKIVAVFHPQGWQDDHAIDLDGAKPVDITKPVLIAALKQADWLRFFKDNSSQADALVDPFALGHAGPYRLEAEDAILAAFNVKALGDIDAAMLLAAARGHLALDGNFDLTSTEEAIGLLRVDLAMTWQAHGDAIQHLTDQVNAVRPAIESALLEQFHDSVDEIKTRYGAMAANGLEDEEAQDRAISEIENWVTSNVTDEVEAIVFELGIERGGELLQDLVRKAQLRAMRPVG